MNTTLARPVLSVAFLLTSLIGVTFLLAFWLSHDVATAFIRAGLFVAVMGIVHVVGYRLYVEQNARPMASRNVDLSLVRPHLSMIAVTQLPCLLLSALLLDGGRGFRICMVAAFAHWLSIAFVLARDRREITRMDSFILRWGFFPCLLFAGFVGNALW